METRGRIGIFIIIISFFACKTKTIKEELNLHGIILNYETSIKDSIPSVRYINKLDTLILDTIVLDYDFSTEKIEGESLAPCFSCQLALLYKKGFKVKLSKNVKTDYFRYPDRTIIRLSNAKIKGNYAFIVLEFVRFGSGQTILYTLRNENNEWKILKIEVVSVS